MRRIRILRSLFALSVLSVTALSQADELDNGKKAAGEAATSAPTTEQLRLVLKDAAKAVKNLEKKPAEKGALPELPDFEWSNLEEPKGEALLAIGSAQARVGDLESARKTWQEALDLASEIQSFNRSAKAALLTEIAGAQADAGEHDDALDSLRQATQAARLLKEGRGRFGGLRLPSSMEGDPAVDQASVLASIAKVQAKAGDQRAAVKSFDQAAETAAAIKNPVMKIRTLVQIAGAQDPSGVREIWDRTLGAALSLTDAFQKAKAVEFVIRALTQMGKEEEALRLAGDRFPGDLRAYSLAVIASELGLREKDPTLHFAQSLRETAKKLEFDRPFKRVKVYSAIAVLFARAGDSEGAYKVIDSLNPDNAVQRTRHLMQKIEVMKEVARAQLKAGQKNDAKETLQTALESVAPFQGDDGELSFPLQGLLELLAKTGDADSAIAIATNVRNSRSKADLLLNIASVQAETGARDAALKTIDHALNAVEGIPNDMLWTTLSLEARQSLLRLKTSRPEFDFSLHVGLKYDALKNAAIALAKAGNVTRAVEIAKRIPTGDDFSGSHESVRAFAEIASTQTKSGDFEGALKTADLIQENGTLFSTEKAAVLGEIAREQARRGEARKVLERGNSYNSPKTRLNVWQQMADGIAEKKTPEKNGNQQSEKP